MQMNNGYLFFQMVYNVNDLVRYIQELRITMFALIIGVYVVILLQLIVMCRCCEPKRTASNTDLLAPLTLGRASTDTPKQTVVNMTNSSSLADLLDSGGNYRPRADSQPPRSTRPGERFNYLDVPSSSSCANLRVANGTPHAQWGDTGNANLGGHTPRIGNGTSTPQSPSVYGGGSRRSNTMKRGMGGSMATRSLRSMTPTMTPPNHNATATAEWNPEAVCANYDRQNRSSGRNSPAEYSINMDDDVLSCITETHSLMSIAHETGTTTTAPQANQAQATEPQAKAEQKTHAPTAKVAPKPKSEVSHNTARSSASFGAKADLINITGMPQTTSYTAITIEAQPANEQGNTTDRLLERNWSVNGDDYS